MAHDESARTATQARLVIRNIGVLLSGDLGRPILDADTVVCSGDRITAVGKEKDVDITGAAVTIDAKGTALVPGLIDSHVHPVCGDWTPRQNQLGWIDGYLHGGVTTMISAGEVHTPGRPKDVVGLKAMERSCDRQGSPPAMHLEQTNAGGEIADHRDEPHYDEQPF
ncbi:MAG: hypothetical protein O8C63_11080 [Candidatus Methanoperedens sp.]|nr:hypothetical protein [Candidatus Methanoperedens sp.]